MKRNIKLTFATHYGSKSMLLTENRGKKMKSSKKKKTSKKQNTLNA